MYNRRTWTTFHMGKMGCGWRMGKGDVRGGVGGHFFGLLLGTLP